jgi:hypothetical protein
MSYTSMCEYIIANSEATVIKENIIWKEKCSFSCKLCSDATKNAKQYIQIKAYIYISKKSQTL